MPSRPLEDDGYNCQLDDSPPQPTPLDQVPPDGSCSPDGVVDALRSSVSKDGSSRDYHCGDFGEFAVLVGEPTGATLRTGLIYDDVGEPNAVDSWPCVALSVDVPIHVVSPVDAAPFELKTVKTDHICWTIVATGTRSDGAEVSLTKEATHAAAELRISQGGQTLRCTESIPIGVPQPIGGVAGDGNLGVAGDSWGNYGGVGGEPVSAGNGISGAAG
jgi:hypothetical protein